MFIHLFIFSTSLKTTTTVLLLYEHAQIKASVFLKILVFKNSKNLLDILKLFLIHSEVIYKSK